MSKRNELQYDDNSVNSFDFMLEKALKNTPNDSTDVLCDMLFEILCKNNEEHYEIYLPQLKETSTKKPKKKKNMMKRCNFDTCREKIKTFWFDCKCGLRFCSKHRLDFEHNCNYNHKPDRINKLRKKLIKTKSTKLTKI